MGGKSVGGLRFVLQKSPGLSARGISLLPKEGFAGLQPSLASSTAFSEILDHAPVRSRNAM
jgi:hypothetical protein